MKSGEIEKLIEKSLENNASGQTAAKELIALGVEALPRTIEALNNLKPIQYPVNLSKVLHLIENPEKIQLLIEALNTGKVEFMMTGLQILGLSRSGEVFLPLIDYLKDAEKLDALRALAADALGELQNEKAIPFLLETIEETESNDLRLSIVMALAKLGNYEKGSIALSLAVSKKDPTIRPKATEALKYLVIPELFSTAKRVLKDKYPEMRMNSVNTLFYLGSKASIQVLIDSINDNNPSLSNLVRQRLEDLTGISTEQLTLKKIKEWWKENEKQFDAGICYRSGQPLNIKFVAELLQEERNQARILEELRIITGIDFSSEKFTEVERSEEQSAQIKKWLDKGGAEKFAPGHLYKYGREQNLEIVFK